MIEVGETRKFGASRRLRVRASHYLVLALSLSGTFWSTLAVSPGVRSVGFEIINLADSGEEESEFPDEDPVTDAEPWDMIPARSRLVRDWRTGDRCRTRLAVDASQRQSGRCGGEGHARLRRGGSAVQLPLRC